MKANTTLPNGIRSATQDATPCSDMQRNKTKARRRPGICKHSTGQGRVAIDGKMYYLGAYGSPECHARYAELIRKWESGEVLSERAPHAAQATMTVPALVAEYLRHVDDTGLYRKGSARTTQYPIVKIALDSFASFCGPTLLPKVREVNVVRWMDALQRNAKLTRGGINRKLRIVVQLLRWARKRDFLPREAWADVANVEPLRRGQCGNRPEHGRERRAVSIEDATAIAAACTDKRAAAVIRLMTMCGMRPGEAVGMKWCDVDRNGPEVDGVKFWLFRPSSHKTAHHGHTLTYGLPPAAQTLLSAFPGVGAVSVFGITPRTFRHQFQRAVRAAGVPFCSPHELRHGAVSRTAASHGLLAAQALANHASAQMTSRYCHRDDVAALKALAQQERQRSG